MADSFSSPGIDLPSPTLSARLRELTDYLAAPTAGRLTEEQRALSLGIARRLIVDVAARLHREIDPAALWRDWLSGGIPCADRLAAVCYARGEEHRWREFSARRGAVPSLLPAKEGAAPADAIAEPESLSDTDRAYLDLRIADRRRFDALGNPCLAVADLAPESFRALLLDIAAWQLAQVSQDHHRAAELGEAVRDMLDRQSTGRGIDAAASAYHDRLGDTLPDAAAKAVEREDWPVLIGLAAAVSGRSYGAMTLALLTAENAALPPLLAPLRLDRVAIARIEASLATLPARAVSGGVAVDDHEAPISRSEDAR